MRALSRDCSVVGHPGSAPGLVICGSVCYNARACGEFAFYTFKLCYVTFLKEYSEITLEYYIHTDERLLLLQHTDTNKVIK